MILFNPVKPRSTLSNLDHKPAPPGSPFNPNVSPGKSQKLNPTTSTETGACASIEKTHSLDSDPLTSSTYCGSTRSSNRISTRFRFCLSASVLFIATFSSAPYPNSKQSNTHIASSSQISPDSEVIALSPSAAAQPRAPARRTPADQRAAAPPSR